MSDSRRDELGDWQFQDLVDHVIELEDRLSQAEAAVEWGPPKPPSQGALDLAAKREIENLRNAVRVHRDATQRALLAKERGSANRELWRHVGEVVDGE